MAADKPHQYGAAWSTRRLSNQDFSLHFKFRVSGSAQKWSGDSLALWLAKDKIGKQGDVFGISEEFVGIGVVFDSHDKMDKTGKHRDIRVLINDGTKKEAELVVETRGCNANFRFDELILEGSPYKITDIMRSGMISMSFSPRG